MIVVTAGTQGKWLKSKVINIISNNEMEVLGEASVDGIKTRGRSNFIHRIGSKKASGRQVRLMGFEAGLKLLLNWYIKNGIIGSTKDIDVIGFKCIFGERNGASFLTQKILDDMNRYEFFTSVYGLSNIEAVREFKRILDVPVVGVFDSSFHHSIPEFRRFLGFPWEWHKKLGIKKYGFNGLSHQYLAAMTYKMEGVEKLNLITIYLEGNSSICAVENKRSIDTSMCFSPDSGLLQRTAVGNIDGTALLFAMNELGLTVEDTRTEIINNAGFNSASGMQMDEFKEILGAAKKGNKRASIAIDSYIEGIRKYIGAFSTVLGNVDCIVFGGEIGENNIYIRKKCLENMDYMGIRLDLARNKELNGQLGIISSDYSVISKAKIYIVPTNEELVVAHFTKKVVEKGRDLNPEEMIFRL
jgi:acetate kinase